MDRAVWRLLLVALLTVLTSGVAVPLAGAADKSASISGVVTDSRTGEPLAELCVDAREPDGELAGRAFTDASGAYTVPWLYPGDYVVEFNGCPNRRDPAYTTEYWRDTPDLSSAEVLRLGDDQERDGVDEALVGSPDNGLFHVAPTGKDTRRPDCPGGSLADPWRTLRHAMMCLRPGDTLLVRGGTYDERVLPVLTPGTARGPIRVANYRGERVLVRGMILMTGADHWTLSGINVTADGKSYGPGEYLVKFRDGVGWDFLDGEVWGARSYAAFRVETADTSTSEPAGWRIADSCIHTTRTTHAPYQDHNLYVSTGVRGGRGTVERNLLFGAPNGQNLKLGIGGDTTEGTARVTVRHNTMWDAVQNVLAVGASHHNVVERNILGGVRRPKDWYPHIRGFELSGQHNVARHNLGQADSADQRFIVDDAGSTTGWADGGGNRFPVNPKLANPDRCSGFQPRADVAKAYGRHANDPTRAYPHACPRHLYPRNLFTDDDHSVHEVAVDCLAWDRHAIVRGVNAGQFRPGGAVTRAQMASFVVRMLRGRGVDLPSAPPDAFRDDDGNPHEAAIDLLAALGVVGGIGADHYDPDAAVSRAQMATFLVRAYELAAGAPLAEGGDRFVDDRGSVHEVNINKAAGAGLARGVSGDRYAPGRDVRRAQMATFLARSVDRLLR